MKSIEEMNLVYRTAAGFALEQLEKNHEFHPFAVVNPGVGEIRMIALADDQIDSDGLKSLQTLRKILAREAEQGRIRCVAVAYIVRVRLAEATGGVSDAVRIELEHVDGRPAAGILPYTFAGNQLQQPLDPFFEAYDGCLISKK